MIGCIHGHLQPFAEGPLDPHAPGRREYSAPSVQPLRRAILVEQADSNAQRGECPDKLLGPSPSACRDALPQERPATATW